MPSPLPSGVVDTGITQTFTSSFVCKFRKQAPSGSFEIDGGPGFNTTLQTYGVGGALGNTNLGTNVDSYATVEARLTYDVSPGTPATVVVDSGAGSASGDPGLMGGITCQKVAGPYRLGVTLNADLEAVYEWFSDSSTTITYTIGGTALPSTTGPVTPVSIGWLPSVTYGLYETDDLSPSDVPTYPAVEVSSQDVNGSGVSGGPFTFTAAGNVPSTLLDLVGERYFGPPTKWTLDLDAIDADATAEAADFNYTDPNAGVTTGTCPATPTFSLANSGSGSPGSVAPKAGAASLADPWLSAQQIRPRDTELAFTLEGNQLNDPSLGSYRTWNVGTLAVTNGINALNAASSAVWSTDLGTVTIGGTTAAPTFNVTSAPAIVKRPLQESWRDWNNPLSGDYQSGDDWTTTKHDYYASGANDDVWGWGLYAYLDVDLTPGAAGDVAFEVTWAIVRDEQTAAGTPTPTVETVVNTYTGTWGAGRSTQRLDLLFPNELGHPFHGERVDQIRLIGLQTGGVYTLHSMTLTPVEDGYVKVSDIGTNPITLTALPGGITLAQDGQMAVAHWGRDTVGTADSDDDGSIDRQKDHQNGLLALATSVTAVLTGNESLGGAIGARSGPATMQDVLTEAGRMEGLTATYSDTQVASDFTDGTNSIGTRLFSWLKPNLPHDRVTPGSAYTVNGRLTLPDWNLAAGTTAGQQYILQRHRLGSAIEVQAVDSSGQRAAAAQTVTLRITNALVPSGGDTIHSTAMTDASGYATLPIRYGWYNGGLFTAYLDG